MVAEKREGEREREREEKKFDEFRNLRSIQMKLRKNVESGYEMEIKTLNECDTKRIMKTMNQPTEPKVVP